MIQKSKLAVLDIDDTLTDSQYKHEDALLFALKHFGIENIDTNWKNYENASDSYIFKVNYERTFKRDFTLSFISEFEKVMTERFATHKDSNAIKGALNMINKLLHHSDYGICFATGSLMRPAILKLQQAKLPVIPEIIAASNGMFSREEIVTSAIKKAEKYFEVSEFEEIISFGDGLWDLTTATNLNLHFVGVNDKNKKDFNLMGVKHHIKDWNSFQLQETEKKLGIQL